MKQILKGFLSLALLCSAPLLAQNNNNLSGDSSDIIGGPVFYARPQGDNLARRMVGEVHNLIRCDLCDCFNGIFSGAVEYTRSFDRDDLGRFLFFNGKDNMVFGGQNIAAADKDVNGINFLLADDFIGTVKASPRIENIIVDLNLRLNLYEWACGLYFEVGVPINWTRWAVDLEETTTNPGSTIAADELGNAMDADAPYERIKQAWAGNKTFNDVKKELKFGKIHGRQTKTSVADLEFVLGYDFYCNDCGHFGINARVTAPTGTRPDAEYFFEPIVGNRKHVQLGAGISAHSILWENGCDQSFSVWFEGVGYHLFENKEHRTFDLKNNGVGSRYLLFKKFDSNNDYAGEILQGPNVTTLEVKTDVAFAGEGVIMFDYQRCGFTFDVGYNVWGRTGEKIKLHSNVEEKIGIKGNGETIGGVNVNNTASKTQIDGTDANMFDATNVYLTNDSLNIDCAAHPSALSHKIFAHLGYAWENCDYEPFMGIGGEAEFSGRGNRALDQWGVWFKAGVFFS